MTSVSIPDPKTLSDLGEYLGAGFCEMPDSSPGIRYSRAFRRWFENCPVPEYEGTLLYPAGLLFPDTHAAIIPSYSYTFELRLNQYDRKYADADEDEKQALAELRGIFGKEWKKAELNLAPHTIGGNGYTHAIVNYGRVLSEGLDSYENRVKKGLIQSENQETTDLYTGLLDLLAGIRTWHSRLVHAVEEGGGDSQILFALEQVPFKPARNFYEAMLSYNIVYYLDGCDNPGRMDQVLFPYYEKDHKVGREKALALMREFSESVAVNGGWSAALGGGNSDNSPAYNELTGVIIESTRNLHRPSLELRVRDDMPDEIWDVSMETLATGCGQPAFYNEQGYLDALRFADLGVSEEDLVKWNGGGCTETMIHGCSNVGSLDAGINLLLVLEETLTRELKNDGVTFEVLISSYKDKISSVVSEVTDELNKYYKARAEHRPQMVRTLLIDDCIEKGKEFNSGGARYNWSVINIAGLANAADSLEAIREVVFKRKEISASELLSILQDNFKDKESFRQKLLRYPKFGNDIESVDTLAAEIGEYVYTDLLKKECARGGKFLSSHIMFETYAWAGAQVGATPDGRYAHEPVSDSSGPMQGRDRNGPTALLKSVSRLPQHLLGGTPVLNVRFSKQMFSSRKGRANLRFLIEEYFRMGGLQVQVSVLDQEELKDALEHPEKHEDLIVRIGGYSTYFNWLSDGLKQEVIKRTEYLL